MSKIDPYYTVHIEAEDKKTLKKISKRLHKENIPYTWDSNKNVVFEIYNICKDDILKKFKKFNIIKFDDENL